MAPDKTEKTTVMFLNVDLKCPSCYKKVKKVICKFPQIRDQIYFENENKVQITVVCCSPEKIRDKLCYKGGGVIKSIMIVEQSKPQPKQADKPKEAPKPEKPKEAEKPKKAEKPKDPEKPKEATEKPKDKPKDPEKPKEKPKDPEKPKEKPKEPEKPKEGPPALEPMPVPMKQPEPISNVPAPGQVMMMPVSHGFPPPMYCYEPSYEWYGTPVAPPRPCYDNYPNWCRCGQPRGYDGCRCDYTYFNEENSAGCTIM